ncbi:MAG TPA: hypothetical protein VMS81_02425, partial [Methanomicrobiales archaeon]|nr:hypothetical protein [Methanomicrobiales archaeon]
MHGATSKPDYMTNDKLEAAASLPLDMVRSPLPGCGARGAEIPVRAPVGGFIPSPVGRRRNANRTHDGSMGQESR